MTFLTAFHRLDAAPNPGEQVVLVYNTRVPDSKLLAEHYAEMRHVPKSQILGYPLPTAEFIGRGDFTENLQKPLNKDLVRLGLITYAGNRAHGKVVSSRIRYLALCFGVPLGIGQDDSLQPAAAEKIQPGLRRNSAAVDSELACLPLMDENFPFNGPFKNPFYGATNAALMNPAAGLLMVTRLDGPYAEVALRLVDKAMQAETDGLWGRAYFDLRGLTNGGYVSGDLMLRTASEVCRAEGYDTIVDSNENTFPREFPLSNVAIYAGWYDENVSGPFAPKKVEFMPGAFAYHLHSFNAAGIRTTTSRWVGPLLARGATVTMGTVDEPYLQFTTDVAVLLSRWIRMGFTYGEAAYAAQPALSWQTTIIGDPLYRPFSPGLAQRHASLEAANSPLLEWSYDQLSNLLLMRDKSPLQMIDTLQALPLTQKSPVLKEKLAGLYTGIGENTNAIRALRDALKLSSSPQQKVRLTFDLAALLRAEKQTEDLFDLYARFAIDSPDYPDKVAIYRNLAALARQLGRIPEADGYDRIVKDLTPPPEPPSAK